MMITAACLSGILTIKHHFFLLTLLVTCSWRLQVKTLRRQRQQLMMLLHDNATSPTCSLEAGAALIQAPPGRRLLTEPRGGPSVSVRWK